MLDLKLRGVDTPLNKDWDILVLANTCLDGHTALALNAGTQQKLILPYGLPEKSFEGSTWRKIHNHTLYLQATSSLTTKEIQLN